MNVYVLALASALARAGIACDVYTRSTSSADPPTVVVEPGLRVNHVPAGPASPLDKGELEGVVPEFTAGVLERLKARPPVDAIHANYWLSGMAGHALKHALDLPLLSTFHTLARVKADAGTFDSDIEARAEIEAQVMGCSDAILASGPVEALQLETLYGADPDRIAIVPLGVDRAFFGPGDRAQARRAAGLPRDVPLLLAAGRIQPLKGFDVAIKALACLGEHPDAHLVLLGGPSGRDGVTEAARLRNLVQAFGLMDRVRFLAPVRHELLSTYYRAADVVLVPSRSESFGLVALEAQACGVPVVASAVGGLTTIVEDGRTGYLVDGRGPFAYADRVAAVLGDQGLASRLGAAGAATATSYSWAAAAGHLQDVVVSLRKRELVTCA